MRYFIFILLPIFLLLPSCTGKTDTDKASANVIWTCPMHPSVESDRPGACPVCHMDLVKKVEAQELDSKDEAMLRSVTLSPAQRVLANIETEPAMQRSLKQTFRAVGVVDFAEPLQVSVSARFRGRIEKLHVAITGANVRRGQPLFDLYSPELISTQQDYIVALNALDQARSSGGADEVAMQKRLVDATRERLTLHYGLSAVQTENLERSRKSQPVVTVQAPINGTIIRKSAQEGRYVDEGSVVYEVADLSRLWVYLEISEQQLHLVKTGLAVVLTADAWPGESFRGKINFIDPVMQGQTRTTRVRVEVPNPAGKLKPQMYVTGGIEVADRDQLAVPTTAILRTGKRSIVWVETDDNVFEPREVTLGAQADGMTQITGGLEEGALVAVSGGYLIDSESTLLHPGLAAAGTKHGETDQHATQEETQRSGAASDKASPVQVEKRQSADIEIRILVKAGYHPDTIQVRKGQRIRLVFERRESAKCSEEIVFPDLNIRKMLPAFRSTVIDIPPQAAGTYTFQCGMDMLHGSLVVK
ncbi:MAG: efflux RND transporter periplasmic adaptor subunit [Bacteroidota bacterium]